MERNDVKAASFTYSLNILRLLLQMKLITEEEFNKITKTSNCIFKSFYFKIINQK